MSKIYVYVQIRVHICMNTLMWTHLYTCVHVACNSVAYIGLIVFKAENFG